MDFLINKYFCDLPQDIKDMLETRIIYTILQQDKTLEYGNFLEMLRDQENKKNLSIIHELPTQNFSDLRVRKYVLSHFRKFNQKEGKPYMLDFVDKETESPMSLFLMGKNGSGKTSLYNGLEYIYKKGHISTMLQRNIDRSEEYLPYGNFKKNAIKIVLEINEKENEEYRVLSELSELGINLSSLFCSEYDLQMLQTSHDLIPFFLENLGMGKILDIICKIDDIIKSLSPTDDVVNIESYSFKYGYLPIDIFHLASYKDRKNEIERLKNTFLPGLEKILNTKSTETSIGMYYIKNQIEYLLGVLSVSKELKQLLVVQEIQTVKEKYQQVANKIAENSLLDAYELYRSLPQIELFVAGLRDYVLQLLKIFYDLNSSKMKLVDTHIAIKKIEELLKQEDEDKRKELERKNRESITIEQAHIDNLTKIRNAINEIYQKKIYELFDVCQNTIVPLLNEFTKLSEYSHITRTETKEPNETIRMVLRNNEMYAEIINKKIFGDTPVSPRIFYNSFRFKLYCISVKVALAFMNMKLNNFKAPLIFDDVFTASDFDNSINIDMFFKIIFKIFEKYGIGTKKNELQIIFFTHDEVVLNSVTGAINTIEPDKNDIRFIRGILLDTETLDKDDLRSVPAGQFGEEIDNGYILYEKIN